MSPIEARLFHPAPGGAIAAARDFGIDLSLLLVRLRRSPEERLRDLQEVMNGYEKIRGAARHTHDQARTNADRPRSKSS
jgi:hypothetical protein